MITVTFDSGNSQFVNVDRHGDAQNLATQVAANFLKELKLGTTITIKSNNPKPAKHSGQYYLLFMEEFEEVYILYLDKQGVLRQVFYGPDARVIEALYHTIADDTPVRVLKSSNKKAYRVVSVDANGAEKPMDVQYKNKSSEVVSEIYMEVFKAIKVAVYNYSKTGGTYKVITPKDTVLFQVG